MTPPHIYSFRFECCSSGAYGPTEKLAQAVNSLNYYHQQHINYKKCTKKPTVMLVRHTKTGQEMDISMLDPDYDDMTPDFTENIDEVL